jgi:DNA-binding beta-propeller fold protein YncE
MPSSIAVDRANGDIYVSDGEGAGTNRRVAVFDAAGRFQRHWIMEDMENVHCMAIANDGSVYVCNRYGSAIRIYDKTGKLQRTIAVPWTPVTPPKNGVIKEAGGSAVAIDFSPDPEQKHLFVINQNNAQIEIIERATGRNLGSFGRPGSFPGQFNQVHGIAVDSRGNIYLSENRGRRIHKFIPVSQ